LREDADQELIKLLERVGTWLADQDKVGQSFDGNLFIYAGSPDHAQVAPGSILRGIRWKQDSQLAGFELIDGRGRKSGEQAHFWLPSADAIHVGTTLDGGAVGTARRLRDRYPAAGDGSWASIDLQDPAELPPWPNDTTDKTFGTQVDWVLSQTGRWIEDSGVDFATADAPPVFTGCYMVAAQDGVHQGYIGVGSIVQGVEWDRTDSPKYKVVEGWAGGVNESYIVARALTYLGPVWDEAWTETARDARTPGGLGHLPEFRRSGPVSRARSVTHRGAAAARPSRCRSASRSPRLRAPQAASSPAPSAAGGVGPGRFPRCRAGDALPAARRTAAP
jgi:hypothetical protein